MAGAPTLMDRPKSSAGDFERRIQALEMSQARLIGQFTRLLDHLYAFEVKNVPEFRAKIIVMKDVMESL